MRDRHSYLLDRNDFQIHFLNPVVEIDHDEVSDTTNDNVVSESLKSYIDTAEDKVLSRKIDDDEKITISSVLTNEKTAQNLQTHCQRV